MAERSFLDAVSADIITELILCCFNAALFVIEPISFSPSRAAQFLECCKCAPMISAVPSRLMFCSSKVCPHLSSLSKLLADKSTVTQAKPQLMESCLLSVPEWCRSMFVCVSGDVITRRHTVEMSEQNRDQLAKAIYGRLFSYLLNTANDHLQGQEDVLGYDYVCVCLCSYLAN